jgi:hypothetical protein
MKIVATDLDSLKTAERNPKTHAQADIQASIRRFGFTEPIVVDQRTGRMVAGHGRREALLELKKRGEVPAGVEVRDGRWFVPVLTGWASKDDTEAEAYVIASNRLTEVGGWDEKALAEMLGRLNTGDLLAGTGYEPTDVDALLRSVEPPKTEVGATPAELLPGFLSANIKQVVLYFEGAAYDVALARLKAVMEAHGVQSHTEAVLKLLDLFDATRTTPAN